MAKSKCHCADGCRPYSGTFYCEVVEKQVILTFNEKLSLNDNEQVEHDGRVCLEYLFPGGDCTIKKGIQSEECPY